MKTALLKAFARADPALRRLVLVTMTLACAAPVFTRISRIENLPIESYPIFGRLFTFNDHWQSLAMLGALFFAVSSPSLRDAVSRFATWMSERPGQAALLSFAALAMGAQFVYRAHPLSMDEYAPWMQAHAFAKGSAALHYPPALIDAVVPQHFQGMFMLVDHQTGAVTSAYWPGLALLLTPLAALNLGWCLNPAFGALTLLLLHRLASDAAGTERAGGWAMLAALASPQFVVSAMSWYAMPGELALNLLFLWLLLRPSHRSAFAAGLVGGLCLLMHNPVPHTLMAVPCLFWLAVNRARWTRLISALAGYLPLGVTLGVGWWVWKSGFGDMAVLSKAAAGQPAGLMAALSQVLGWPDAALLSARWQAAWKTWIWACPGLLLMPLMPRQRTLAERLLLYGFMLTFIFYLFVRFDQGHGWGYRYIHPVWGALPVVAGLWISGAHGRAKQWGAAMLAAGLLATPVFLWQTQATLDSALSYRISPEGPGDWVVFVSQDTGAYVGDLVQNANGPGSPLILASEGERADQRVIAQHFPDAIQVMQDWRGSAWRLPAGRLSTTLTPTMSSP